MVAWHGRKVSNEAISLWKHSLYALTATTAAIFSNPERLNSEDNTVARRSPANQDYTEKINNYKNSVQLTKLSAEFKLPALTYSLSPNQSAPPKLVMVGGGKIPTGAINWFGEVAGGADPDTLIVVIGLASRTPEYYHKVIVNSLEGKIPSEQIVLAPHPDKLFDSIKNEQDRFVELCQKATGIVLSGGSQQKGIDYLRRMPAAMQIIQDKYNDGIPFLGTSAGLAMLNKTMPLAAGKIMSTDARDYPLGEGLGFANKDTYFEQHGNRNDFAKGEGPARADLITTRLIRTMAITNSLAEDEQTDNAVLRYKRGVCVHEDTALITVGDVFKVEGEKVVIYDPRGEIDVLLNGECYNLSEGKRYWPDMQKLVSNE